MVPRIHSLARFISDRLIFIRQIYLNLFRDKEEMMSRIARLENDLTEEKERTRDGNL